MRRSVFFFFAFFFYIRFFLEFFFVLDFIFLGGREPFFWGGRFLGTFLNVFFGGLSHSSSYKFWGGSGCETPSQMDHSRRK